MNPRYWKWVNQEWFSEDSIVAIIVGILVGVTLFVVGGPVADVNGWYWTWLSMLVAFIGGPLAGFGTAVGLDMLPIVNTIPDRFGYGREDHFRDTAREYLMLSKDDKREFTSNILQVFVDPQLTEEQRESLNDSMRSTLAYIQKRHEARDALDVQQRIDIDHHLEYMNQQRNGIKSDIKTYKEFA